MHIYVSEVVVETSSTESFCRCTLRKQRLLTVRRPHHQSADPHPRMRTSLPIIVVQSTGDDECAHGNLIARLYILRSRRQRYPRHQHRQRHHFYNFFITHG